jgi:SAM-dependent methyltransferase
MGASLRLIMQGRTGRFSQKDFWLVENLRYAQPYFRLEKCARIVNKLAHGKCCELLDIGCGPATLGRLLQENVHYFGIDIAIHDAAPNLREVDFAREEINFDNKDFDVVVAAGVFEYLGALQSRKFSEIRNLLRRNGKFVVTYTNFEHVNDKLVNHSIYNNIQTIDAFKASLESFFHIDRWFPSSHNLHCSEPRRKYLKNIQMPLELAIPIISRKLAVNYFFICSLR